MSAFVFFSYLYNYAINVIESSRIEIYKASLPQQQQQKYIIQFSQRIVYIKMFHPVIFSRIYIGFRRRFGRWIVACLGLWIRCNAHSNLQLKQKNVSEI